MNALTVTDLTKRYDRFTLDRVSFNIKQGNITGLIGRNGAGKTTTIKAILNLISSEGKIEYFGKDLFADEQAIKQRIGYVSGGFDFYKSKTLRSIAKTVALFYPSWNNEEYQSYLHLFNLDERKKVGELSAGMKVKFSIALALSHGAELLIMDEPTSGLDPLSREDFCDTILELSNNHNITILFSTHITSDLMRIADDVIYVSDGRVVLQEDLKSLLNKYRLIRFDSEAEAKSFSGKLIGLKRIKDGFAALTDSNSDKTVAATLDDIIIHMEAEKDNA